MSQENVEVIRRTLALVNRGDFDEAFSYYQPTATWHSRRDEPDTGDAHGVEGIRQVAEMWVGMFDELQFDLEVCLDIDDYVLTEGWMWGRGRESGAEVRDRFIWVFRLREGKVDEVWEFHDRAEALEAVGQRE